MQYEIIALPIAITFLAFWFVYSINKDWSAQTVITRIIMTTLLTAVSLLFKAEQVTMFLIMVGIINILSLPKPIPNEEKELGTEHSSVQ